jgi:hypothetical protein
VIEISYQRLFDLLPPPYKDIRVFDARLFVQSDEELHGYPENGWVNTAIEEYLFTQYDSILGVYPNRETGKEDIYLDIFCVNTDDDKIVLNTVVPKFSPKDNFYFCRSLNSDNLNIKSISNMRTFTSGHLYRYFKLLTDDVWTIPEHWVTVPTDDPAVFSVQVFGGKKRLKFTQTQGGGASQEAKYVDNTAGGEYLGGQTASHGASFWINIDQDNGQVLYVGGGEDTDVEKVGTDNVYWALKFEATSSSGGNIEFNWKGGTNVVGTYTNNTEYHIRMDNRRNPIGGGAFEDRHDFYWNGENLDNNETNHGSPDATKVADFFFIKADSGNDLNEKCQCYIYDLKLFARVDAGYTNAGDELMLVGINGSIPRFYIPLIVNYSYLWNNVNRYNREMLVDNASGFFLKQIGNTLGVPRSNDVVTKEPIFPHEYRQRLRLYFRYLLPDIPTLINEMAYYLNTSDDTSKVIIKELYDVMNWVMLIPKGRRDEATVFGEFYYISQFYRFLYNWHFEDQTTGEKSGILEELKPMATNVSAGYQTTSEEKGFEPNYWSA